MRQKLKNFLGEYKDRLEFFTIIGICTGIVFAGVAWILYLMQAR